VPALATDRRIVPREVGAGAGERRRLADHPRGGPTGSRLPEVTRCAILMLKEANPDWGCDRIAALLLRGAALAASSEAVARVLRETGYEAQERPTRPFPAVAGSFRCICEVTSGIPCA
jgi:hypothetical protein